MNAVIYQLVCTRFFRPFVVKYIKKLQEKSFDLNKNLAFILPQNWLKVSNYRDFLLFSRHELDQNIKNLSAYINTSANEIVEVSIPAQTLYCRTISCSNIIEKTNFLRDTALFALNKYGMDFSKRQYATEYTLENPDETTFCISVPENSTGEGIIHLPSSRGISVNHHGCYEELHTANKQLLEYAHAYNLSHSGRFRNIYLEGPPQHKNKNLFITQVILLF